jgi:hypothetical protein
MSTATPENEFVTPAGVLWDDPEPGRTWTVSLVGIIILAALIIAISVIYFRTEQAEVNAKVIEPEYLALKDLRAAQEALLASGGTYRIEIGGAEVERKRIPVVEAMRLMAANPALAVPPAAPKPAPAAAPAAAPAPSN